MSASSAYGIDGVTGESDSSSITMCSSVVQRFADLEEPLEEAAFSTMATLALQSLTRYSICSGAEEL